MALKDTEPSQYQNLIKSDSNNASSSSEKLPPATTSSSQDTDQSFRDLDSEEVQYHEGQMDDLKLKQASGGEDDENASNPAAFTITFDDDKGPKRFGIRDSIRKFAPPKPHTIEKPRPQKNSQDGTCDSIEFMSSGPGSMQYHSDHSQQKLSKVSDSAKFLIDRMLNCKNQPPSNETDSAAGESASQALKCSIEFSDDKSDNGTYVIGADPESDAARSKIDELFGVMKSAEASLLAEAATYGKTCSTNKPVDHASGRLTSHSSNIENNDILGTRRNQDRVGRTRAQGSSSTSCSSQQENEHQTRASRRSRNSSVDRASRVHTQHRPKRSISQASRNSSQRDPSDGDTRSSLSSLQNFSERPPPVVTVPSQPSMRFNRTVALRRARLGLGDPIVGAHAPVATPVASDRLMSPLSAQGRQRSSHGSQRPAGSEHSSTSFSRDDGGRFSLRTKGFTPSARYSSNSARQYQPGSVSSRYQGPSVKSHQLAYTIGSGNFRQSRVVDATNVSPSMNVNLDDRSLLADSVLDQTDPQESDSDSTAHRLQYTSLNTFDKLNVGSPSRKPIADKSSLDMGGFQYGNALDSLVVSAISSLSSRLSHSVCDVLVEQARKLPRDNEVRVIVEETIPQLMMDSGSPKSAALIDRPLVCNDLSRTLKNLRKIEQMVDVIGLISSQLSGFVGGRALAEEGVSQVNSKHKDELASSSSSADNTARSLITARRAEDSDVSAEINSMNELSS